MGFVFAFVAGFGHGFTRRNDDSQKKYSQRKNIQRSNGASQERIPERMASGDEWVGRMAYHDQFFQGSHFQNKSHVRSQYYHIAEIVYQNQQTKNDYKTPRLFFAY